MKKIIKVIYLNFRKYFFYLLCLLFCGKKRFSIKSNAYIRKILFIRIDRIGDLVLSTPALKTIKLNYPNARLFVLVSRSNQDVLKNNPYVDDTLIYNDQSGFIQKIKLFGQLRKHKFDLAIDPYTDYEIKTALITFLSGAERRVGFSAYGRQVFFSHPVPEAVNNKHFIEQTLDVPKPLNVHIGDKSPQTYFSEYELKWSTNWIKQNLSDQKPIFGFHPGAFQESQRWIPEYFAELINRLQRNNEFEIIMFGSQDDRILIEHIDSMTVIRPIKFISENLRQFTALLSHCNIFICNNSGPLHIAVATKIPTISFMGPTLKERWMPVGDIHQFLRIDDLPCIGCNSGICKIDTHDCMKLIIPSVVLKKIYSKLDSSANTLHTSIYSP